MDINPNNIPMNMPPVPPSPTAIVRDKKSNWVKFLVSGLLIVIILAIGFTGFVIYNQSSIEVLDQSLQKTVSIKKLVLRNPGFLGIQRASRYGKPGANIGATEYLPPDTYTEFTIDLSIDLFDPNATADPLSPRELLFATIYEDSDGSKVLSSGDKPVKDLFGRPVSVRFRLK